MANKIEMRIEAENMATAEIDAEGTHAQVRVDSEVQWDGPGLLKFAAALRGVALVLMSGEVSRLLTYAWLIWDVVTPNVGLIQYTM